MFVKVRRNDYDTSGDEFVIAADRMDRSMDNNIITRAILATAGDIAGTVINLDTESFTVNGWIRNPEADSYPDYVSVDTNEWSLSTEMELNLAQAMRTWGPNPSDGFDTLVWGPRERSGMMSSYRVTEDAANGVPEHYDITIEWTHANIIIGD